MQPIPLLRLMLISVFFLLVGILFFPQQQIAKLGNTYAPDGLCEFCTSTNPEYRVAALFFSVLLFIAVLATFRYQHALFSCWTEMSNEMRNNISSFKIKIFNMLVFKKHWAIFGVFLIGTFLRLRALFAPIRYDEAYTFLTYASKPLVIALTLYDSTNNHLLYTLLEFFSVRIFGDSVAAIRLPAFLFGIAMIPITYVVFSKILSKKIGLFTAIFVAVSPYFIFYSVNGRGYTLAITLFLVTLFCFFRYQTEQKSVWIVGMGMLFALMLYSLATMIYAVLAFTLLLVLGIFLDYRKHNIQQFKQRFIHASVVLPASALLTFLLYTPILLVQGTNLFQNNRFTPVPYGQLVTQFMPFVHNFLQLVAWDTVSGIILIVLALMGVYYYRDNEVVKFFGLSLLVIGALIFIQRVVPYDRQLGFLIPLLFVFASSGIIHLLDMINYSRVGYVDYYGVPIVAGIVLISSTFFIVIVDIPDSFALGRCTGCAEAVAHFSTHPPQVPLMIDLTADIPFQYYSKQREIPYSGGYGLTQHGFPAYTVLFPGVRLEDTSSYLIVPGLTFNVSTWVDTHKRAYNLSESFVVREEKIFPDFELYFVSSVSQNPLTKPFNTITQVT